MNPFDFFDTIYCISASARSERRNKAFLQFQNLDISDRVEFVDAILREPYWVGCRESHRACIKKAQDKGAENVLIFEDDVLFLHRDFSALSKALNTLDKYEWDIFTLGHSVQLMHDDIDDNLCLTKGNLTHAWALHKRCWEEILNYPHTEDCIDIPNRNGCRRVFNKSNIDIYSTANFKKFMIKPIMAIQPDKADITLTTYYNKII